MRLLECRCAECGRDFGVPLEPDERPERGGIFQALCPFCETKLVITIEPGDIPAREGEIVIPARVRSEP